MKLIPTEATMVSTNPNRRSAARMMTLLALAAAASVLACGGGGGGGGGSEESAGAPTTGGTPEPTQPADPGDDPHQHVDAIIPDFVKIVDTSQTAPPEVDETGTVYTFAPGTGGLDDLQPFDIVVGTDGDGYLRRVTGITRLDDGSVRLQGEQAGLAEAVEQGCVHAGMEDFQPGEVQLDEGVEMTLLPGGRAPRDAFYSLGRREFKVGGTGWQVKAILEFDIDVLDFNAKLDWFSIESANLTLKATWKVQLEIVLGTSVSGSGPLHSTNLPEITADPEGLKRWVKRLFWIPMPFMVAIGPVPVTGKVNFNIMAGAEFQVALGVVTLKEEGSVTLGWEKKKGGDWKSICEPDGKSDLQVDPGLRAKLTGFIRPELELEVYGAKGPSIGPELRGEATVTLALEECMVKFTAKIVLQLVGILKLKILGWEQEFVRFEAFRLELVIFPERKWPLTDCDEKPAPITDLEAWTGPDIGSVRLDWTAVGSNGIYGTAAHYIVYYSHGAFSGPGPGVEQFVQTWRPLEAGSPETHLVTGLDPEAQYYFMIVAVDSNGGAGPDRNAVGPAFPRSPPRPGTITNLSAATSSPGCAQLSWTAPWPDGSPLVQYLMKYSESPITEATWDAATTYTQIGAPLPSGNTESYQLVGLEFGKQYYFAIKAVDSAGNISRLSNQVTAVAGSPDLGAVTNLAATTGEIEGSLKLTWTAPQGEGYSPTAYWVNIDPQDPLLVPATELLQAEALQGQQENRTLTGLLPGKMYEIKIKAHYPNWGLSDWSNVAAAEAGDEINHPPGAIKDLAAYTGTFAGTVVLTWTATGADEYAAEIDGEMIDVEEGTLTGYILKYSLEPITAENFDAATTHVQNWAPLAPGEEEEKTLEGLIPEMHYYFAIKAVDGAGLVSPISWHPDVDANPYGPVDAIAGNLVGRRLTMGRSGNTAMIAGDSTLWGWGNGSWAYQGVGAGRGMSLNLLSPTRVEEFSGAASIDAGFSASVVLKGDGTVWQWGNIAGANGIAYSPVQAPGLTQVIAVAAGYRHYLALRADGTVWSWGEDGEGQLGLGMIVENTYFPPQKVNGLPPIKAIAAGVEVSLALDTTGHVWTWGSNIYGQLGNGQSGYDEITWDPLRSAVPIQVPNLDGVFKIATGGYHVLAIRTGGTVWAWGYGYEGELGNGTSTEVSSPIQVPGLTNMVDIAAGEWHSLALRNDDTLWAWGYNGAGELGDGTYQDCYSPTPVLIQEQIVEIEGGAYSSMARSLKGRVWTWGWNGQGRLGDGTTEDRPSPTVIVQETAQDPLSPAAISGLTPAPGDYVGRLSVVWTAPGDDGSAGSAASYVVKYSTQPITEANFDAAPTYYQAWTPQAAGSVENHVLEGLVPSGPYYVAIRAIDNALRPSPIATVGPVSANATKVLQIATGSGTEHTLAILQGDTVAAWGSNVYGELGVGLDYQALPHAKAPLPVSGLSNVVSVATGQAHSVAADFSGNVWAWGSHSSGQLGNGGGISSSMVPVQVPGLSGITQVAAGGFFCLALQGNSKIWKWGSMGIQGNSTPFMMENGAIGDGTVVPLGNGQPWVAIAAGDHHALALGADGIVWSWGKDERGEVGDRNPPEGAEMSSSYYPGWIKNLTGVVAISAGRYHSLALKADGTVWAWGDNSYGQLGIGMTYPSVRYTTPVQIPGLVAVEISAGEYHSVARTDLGAVVAWGLNTSGEITGVADGAVQFTPTALTGMPQGIVKVIARGNTTMMLLADGSYCGWGANDKANLGNGANVPFDVPVLLPAAPARITDLVATPSLTEGLVTLTFTTPASGAGGGAVSGYLVRFFDQPFNSSGFYTSTDEDYRWIGRVPSNGAATGAGESIDAPGLPMGKTTYYSVVAVNEQGVSSAPSNVVSAAAIPARATGAALGTNHSLLLTEYGMVWQAGDSGNRRFPIYGLTNVVAVAAGSSHSLALKSDGTVWAWGDNNSGQIGDGTTASRVTPVQVSGLTGVVQIVASGDTSMAKRADGTIWRWGVVKFDALLWTPIFSTTPVKVDWMSGASGFMPDHAILGSSLWTLGEWSDPRPYYRLKDGVTDFTLPATQIYEPLVNVVAITQGYALQGSGSLWGLTGGMVEWGTDAQGDPYYVPVAVALTPGLPGVVGITANLALRSDGSVWVLNSPLAPFDPPYAVAGLSGISILAPGIAIDAGGQAFAWGSNAAGRLGTGTNYANIYPAVPIW